jgi:hypothetical protein
MAASTVGGMEHALSLFPAGTVRALPRDAELVVEPGRSRSRLQPRRCTGWSRSSAVRRETWDDLLARDGPG